MGLKDFIIKRTVYSIVTLLIVLVLLFTIFRVMPGDPTRLAVEPKASPERKHIQAVQYGLEEKKEYYIVENYTMDVSHDEIFVSNTTKEFATPYTSLTPENFSNSKNEIRATVTNPQEEWFVFEIRIRPLTKGLMVAAGVFLDGRVAKDGIIEANETYIDVGSRTPWLSKSATNGNVLLGYNTIDPTLIKGENNTIMDCGGSLNEKGTSMQDSLVVRSTLYPYITAVRNSILIGTSNIYKSTIENEIWYCNENITGKSIWPEQNDPQHRPTPTTNNSTVVASMIVGSETNITNSNISNGKIFDSVIVNSTLENVIVINSTLKNTTARNVIYLHGEAYPLDRSELILTIPSNPGVQARGNDKNLVVFKFLTLNMNGSIRVDIKVTSYIRTDFFTQLARYMQDMLVFNFGNDFSNQQPVTEGIAIRIGPTVLLFGSATIIAYALGIFLGALLAWRRGSRMELSVIVVSLFFYSMPLFWFGMILIWVFANQIGWFPPGGFQSPTTEKPLEGFEYFKDVLWHLTLPLFTLTITHLAGDVLLMRNSMLEVMGEDYILTAKGKGLKERTILYKHAARNAMLPVVTALALSVGGIVSGGVLTETVFSWPGMGYWLVEATLSQNYPVAQGVFYILAILTIVGNVIADMLYAYLDPRVRL
ncbi:MAG: ABC transporter permease [Thermoplasmata archaeon]